MKNVKTLFLSLIILGILTSCISLSEEQLFSSAFTLVPGTTPEMNTPGYWIGRAENPDGILLDQGGINAFNQDVIDKGYRRSLLNFTAPPLEDVRRDLTVGMKWLFGVNYFFRDGKKVDKDFYEPLFLLMAPENLPEPLVYRYGFLTAPTDLRVLPTDTALHDAPGDYFSDALQITTPDRGTPFLVLHESRDGQWLYVLKDDAGGWIKASRFVFTDQEQFLEYLTSSSKALVISPKIEVFRDPLFTQFHGTLRMGQPVLLALPQNLYPSPVKILLPGNDNLGNLIWEEFWVSGQDLSREPLSYTTRNVLNQAFKMLNHPYGWGGMFGEQDCSLYLQEIFATMGIGLPRNSSRQALVGSPLPGFTKDLKPEDKKKILAQSAIPGTALPRLSGHIVLYIGQVDGTPYGIHATWAYREKHHGEDVIRLINRVVVSTLDLGEGSLKGSLAQRLLQVPQVLPQTSQDQAP